jgi:hypothetical protein
MAIGRRSVGIYIPKFSINQATRRLIKKPCRRRLHPPFEKHYYKMKVFGVGWVSVGTVVDPGFNASKVHQKNPNYQPF